MFTWSDKSKMIVTIVFSLIILIFLLKIAYFYYHGRPKVIRHIPRVRVTRLESDDIENSPIESIRMLELSEGRAIQPPAMSRDPLSLAREFFTFRALRPTETSPPSSPTLPIPPFTPQSTHTDTSPDRTESPPPSTEMSPSHTVTSPPTKDTDTPTTQAPPTTSTPHVHTTCTYVVGKGLVWEDLCPCQPSTDEQN